MDNPWNIIESKISEDIQHLNPAMQESDWERMAMLLDQDKPAGFWLLIKTNLIKFLTFKTFIIMTTFTLVASLFIGLGSGDLQTETLELNSPKLNKVNTTESVMEGIPEEETSKNLFLENINLVASDGPSKARKPQTPKDTKIEGEPIQPEEGVKKLIKAATSALDSPLVNNKPMVMKYWVDTTYTYEYLDKEGAIEDFWMGLHFTTQSAIDAETSSRYHETFGFNFQMMSGNLMNTKNLGLYGGLDWGMQFYGKGESQEMRLNSSTQEWGLTQLTQLSNDLFLKMHLEYAEFRIVPYLTAHAGPKIFSTAQYAEAFQTSSEYETSNRVNVENSTVLAYGLGAGARLKLNNHISLDVRYETQFHNGKDLANLDQSVFDGQSFGIRRSAMNSDFGQFKFGVVFDLSSRPTKKVVDEPGYYEEVIYENVPVSSQDSSTIVLPCPCKPCDDGNDSEWDWDSDPNHNPYIRQGGWNGGGSGSGGSGGGKGGFPGISTPSNH